MKNYSFTPKGVCSKLITFGIDEEGRLRNVKFTSGCPGNLTAIGKLVEGADAREVVRILREAGAEVLGIVSIFTYGMKKGLERLAAAKVENHSLTNFDVITRVAAEDGYIQAEDVRRLIAFRNNPSDESWRFV